MRVAIERQPRYTRDGKLKKTIERNTEAAWTHLPRIGESFSLALDDPEDDSDMISGVVHDVVWFAPDHVRIVVKEK